MIFHDYTIRAGSIHSRRVHDSARIQPDAVAIFRDLLLSSLDAWKRPIPVPGLEHLNLQWTAIESGAIATFSSRDTPLTLSALLTGQDSDQEREILGLFQSTLVDIFHQTPIEPGFDSLTIADRPVILSAPIVYPVEMSRQFGSDYAIIADMETCLAAAYFERSQ